MVLQGPWIILIYNRSRPSFYLEERCAFSLCYRVKKEIKKN